MLKQNSPNSTALHLGIVLLLFFASLFGISCERSHPAPSIPHNAVMQAIREYGAGHQSAQLVPAKSRTQQPAPPSHELDDADGAYEAHIGVVFMQGDFATLEKEAQKARVNKTRLTGATWKIHGLYIGVEKPPSEGQPTEADWEAHIAALKKWVAAYPESATARIALANAYVSYAWAGRGLSYAKDVTNSGWELLAQRIELAKSTLMDAARLKEKCPFWFAVMQNVALAEGWEKSDAWELFKKAVDFEPDFLQYYRDYAYFNLPKWYGKPGEAEQFAEEASQKVGGPDGDILYFEIATLVACQYDVYDSPVPDMSWERIKAGYAAMNQLYGPAYLKANRFAFMAYLLKDKPAAQEALAFVGDNRDPTVWDKGQFTFVQNWVSTP